MVDIVEKLCLESFHEKGNDYVMPDQKVKQQSCEASADQTGLRSVSVVLIGECF